MMQTVKDAWMKQYKQLSFPTSPRKITVPNDAANLCFCGNKDEMMMAIAMKHYLIFHSPAALP